MQAGETDLLNTLKAGDADRYLATLYAPAHLRDDLAALYVFNLEIARIRDAIRDPMPGEFRLQWWRDALNGTSPDTAARHPFAAAMADVIARHELPLPMLENYFEARIFDLYDDPMPSMNDLEGWCGETAGTLIQFAAMILDRDAALAAGGEAAGHAACAQAMTGLIRLFPLHRSRGQCYVPPEVLASAGLTRECFLAGSDAEQGAAVVSAMVSAARTHHRKFMDAVKSLPANLHPAFLPLAVVPVYLDAIDKTGAQALTGTPATGALRRNWQTFRCAMRGFR